MRPIRAAAAAFLAVLCLGACTPEEVIRTIFHDNPDEAVDVAWCESRLNPDAVSPTGDHGLFQINARWHRRNFERVLDRPWSDIYDPVANAAYAKHLYDANGWTPWVCSP